MKKKTGVDSTSQAPPQVIEALSSFDWEQTEPQRLRPYKPKYNITMGEFQTI